MQNQINKNEQKLYKIYNIDGKNLILSIKNSDIKSWDFDNKFILNVCKILLAIIENSTKSFKKDKFQIKK